MNIYHLSFPVDFARGALTQPLPGQCFRGDALSCEIEAVVYDSAAPDTAPALGSIAGVALRPDGTSCVLTGTDGGTRQINLPDGSQAMASIASVTVSSQALELPGQVRVTITGTGSPSGRAVTLLSVIGDVVRKNSGTVIDPEDVIDLDRIVTAAENAETAATGADTAAAAAYAAAGGLAYGGMIPLTWESGSFTMSGAKQADDYGIRTGAFIPANSDRRKLRVIFSDYDLPAGASDITCRVFEYSATEPVTYKKRTALSGANKYGEIDLDDVTVAVRLDLRYTVAGTFAIGPESGYLITARWLDGTTDADILAAERSADRELVDRTHAYIDYDYGTPINKEASESQSATWSETLGIKRNDVFVTLHNNRNFAYAITIRLNGAFDQKTSAEGIITWTDGVELIGGHEYKATCRLLSGESTTGGVAGNAPAVLPIKAGGSTYDAEITRPASGVTVTRFTAEEEVDPEETEEEQEPPKYNICLRMLTNSEYTNARFMITLEDVTASPDGAAEERFDALEDAVADLQTENDISKRFTFKDGKRVLWTKGTLGVSSVSAYSNFVDVSSYAKLRMTCQVIKDVAAWANGVAFYAEPDKDTYIGGVVFPFDNTLEKHTSEIREYTIPTGAKYVRTTWWATTTEQYSEMAFQCVGVKSETKEELPEYYFDNNYIQNRIQAVLAHRQALTVSGGEQYAPMVEFIWFTDPHYMTSGATHNGMNGPKIARYITNHTGIRRVVCGGDVTTGCYSKSQMLALFGEVRTHLEPIWDRTRFIIGNHEYNNTDEQHDSDQMTRNDLYCFWNQDKEQEYGAISPSHTMYWVDDPVNHVRTFYIGCTTGAGIMRAWLVWLEGQMETVPDGWYVLVCSHTGIEKINGVYVIDPVFARVGQMLDLLKAGDDGEVEYPETASIPCHFAGKSVTVIGAITGHRHTDIVKRTDGGIPIISVTCDRGPRPDTKSDKFKTARKLGTIREQAYDVVQIDLEREMIYTTRFGGRYDIQSYNDCQDASVKAGWWDVPYELAIPFDPPTT